MIVNLTICDITYLCCWWSTESSSGTRVCKSWRTHWTSWLNLGKVPLQMTLNELLVTVSHRRSACELTVVWFAISAESTMTGLNRQTDKPHRPSTWPDSKDYRQFHFFAFVFDVERPPSLDALVFEQWHLRHAAVSLEHVQCTQLGWLSSTWKPVHVECQCAYTPHSIASWPWVTFKRYFDVIFKRLLHIGVNRVIHDRYSHRVIGSVKVVRA